MDEFQAEVKKIMLKGMNCGQTMIFLANETRGIENPDMVRGAGGLGGGMFCGENCGAMTGGALVLASYGAECQPGDEATYDYRSAVKELKEWFENEFGSIECNKLVAADRIERQKVCPGFVAKTFQKCMEILEKNGINPNM